MNQRTWTRSGRRLAALAVVAPAVVAVGWLGVGRTGTPAAAQSVPATDGVAQTELQARVEAAASGEPVEVLAFRDERRDVVANPDGTMTVRQYVAPKANSTTTPLRIGRTCRGTATAPPALTAAPPRPRPASGPASG